MKRKPTVNLISAVFIFLFTYTATSKLVAFASFQSTLGKLPVIGSFSPVLAILLPLSELVIATLLFFPASRRIGAFASLIIMLLFTTYIGWAILLDVKLPCSCGGILQSLNWRQHLWLNIFLTLLAWIMLSMQKKTPETESNFSLQ